MLPRPKWRSRGERCSTPPPALAGGDKGVASFSPTAATKNHPQPLHEVVEGRAQGDAFQLCCSNVRFRPIADVPRRAVKPTRVVLKCAASPANISVLAANDLRIGLLASSRGRAALREALLTERSGAQYFRLSAIIQALQSDRGSRAPGLIGASVGAERSCSERHCYSSHHRRADHPVSAEPGRSRRARKPRLPPTPGPGR